MLSNYTLIVPTHNRHQYLPRGIEYYGSSDVKVIIIDSSLSPFPGNIPYSNIEYRHVPGVDFVAKIRNILPLIKTTYCGLCADDDFIPPGALSECVGFLEKNRDYSSVQGNYITFRKLSRNKLMLLPLFHPYLWTLDEAKPSERLKKLFERYFHFAYAVHTSESFKKIFETFDPSIKGLNLFELHIAFVALINGKHKTLPVFYNAREAITNSAGNTELTTAEYIEANPEVKDKFIAALAKQLAAKEPCTYAEAEQKVNELLKNYIANSSAKGKTKLINKIIPLEYRHLLKLARLKLMYGSVDAYNKKITAGKKGFPFNEKENIAELDKIKKIVLRYNF